MKTKPKAKPKIVPKVVERTAKESDLLPAGCLTLLSKTQAAGAIGVSVRKLEGMIAAGGYPPPDMKVGTLPRWRTETHNEWVRRGPRPPSTE